MTDSPAGEPTPVPDGHPTQPPDAGPPPTGTSQPDQVTTLEHSGTDRPTAGEFARYIGDYELLDEIAQGGMGIVFRARQLSLNRIVALKLIVKGEFASEQEVRRFEFEAE